MKQVTKHLPVALLALVLSACAGTGVKEMVANPGAAGAAMDAVKAATLSDAEVAEVARAAAAEMDSNNKVATPKDKYGVRLAKLTQGLDNEDGMNLNFKAYLVRDVNAFAMADGTVRVFAGLMDLMTDDEIRFVIGHEVGHAKLGHSKKALQTAYAASAARKAASASGGAVVAGLAKSELGKLGEELVNAQFSQSQENEADAYGVEFMKRHGYNLSAAITAMQKLNASGGGEHSMLSSHPSSEERITKLKQLVTEAGGHANVNAQPANQKAAAKAKAKK